MRVVIDTNVWVSGLIAREGTPARILELVRRQAIDVVATWELAEEIGEVLRRPRFNPLRVTEADVVAVLGFLVHILPTIEIDVPVRDPRDVPVVAAAVAGRAEAIVSGDRDLIDDAGLRSWLSERDVEVLTPTELADQFP